MGRYLTRHLQNALAALGTLSRQPTSTALTVAVIGIALALPASLQVLVRGGQSFAGNWADVRDFSVYLKPGTALARARELAQELGKRKELAGVELIAADKALDEFRQDAAFGDVLKVLKGNPLPHTLVVRPRAEAAPEALQALEKELSSRADVDLVQLDTQWLVRLHALLDVVRRAVWMAAALLVCAVIVIVGNTIRLDIQNRRQEIEVAKLLGATDAFVRRPFLYIGFWYGLLGGLVALVVLGTGLFLLRGPVSRLLNLYGADFGGFGVTTSTAALVLAAGLLAGCAGAWAAVARHLSAIQPRV
jgi:cell division transport system permease protein